MFLSGGLFTQGGDDYLAGLVVVCKYGVDGIRVYLNTRSERGALAV